MSSKRLREESDDYPAVVVVVADGWRVIECRDYLQWILQRQAGHRHGQPRWDSRSYVRTREALKRAVRASVGAVDGKALRVLDGLPEKLNGQCAGTMAWRPGR